MMAVAGGEYVRKLKRRLKVDTRRRHPTAEWPTTLKITTAWEMIARVSGASSSLRTSWRGRVVYR
jgi:hypothetical protein